jgi:indole-3-glycerol phosphate synthase
MKARTPVMGALADPTIYSPGQLARTYTAAGAAAISVLCQATSFGGRPEHLAEARASTDLPILRKDFVLDEYPIVEARAYGADAVLLIVAALTPERLHELLDVAHRLGMEALVEVHDEAEVEVAMAAGSAVIGVNHRDLHTFQVDLSLTGRLRAMLPADRLLVAESGIHSAADARLVMEAGAQAVLVGEALMRAADPAAKLRELALI